MLDLIGIMVSSIMLLMVIIWTVRQDRQQPWLQPIKVKVGQARKGRARERQ